MKFFVFPILAILALSATSNEVKLSKHVFSPKKISNSLTNKSSRSNKAKAYNVYGVTVAHIQSQAYTNVSIEDRTRLGTKVELEGGGVMLDLPYAWTNSLLQPKRIYRGYVGIGAGTTIGHGINNEFRFVWDGDGPACRVICQPGDNSCTGPLTPFE